MRIMVTGAGGSAGYNVTECLMRAGHVVLGVDTDETMLELSPAHTRRQAARDDWKGLVREHRIKMILPQPEEDVAFLSSVTSHTGAPTILCTLPHLLPNGARMMQDKRQLAQHLGGLTPRNAPYTDGDVRAMLRDYGRPLWMRARKGAGAFAALPIHSVEEARFWYEWWNRETGMVLKDFMVSEYLAGREFTYQGVLRNGKLLAYFVRERVKRMHANGFSGTPSVSRSTHDKDVRMVADATISRLGIKQGVVGIDMKERHENATDLKVTEVNCRFYTTTLFPEALGLNLPDILVTGIRPDQSKQDYKEDWLWVRQPDAGFRLVAP